MYLSCQIFFVNRILHLFRQIHHIDPRILQRPRLVLLFSFTILFKKPPTTIAHWEMLNVLVALRVWDKLQAGTYILIFCDNAAVVPVTGNSRTKDPFFTACLRNILLITAANHSSIIVKHISGSKSTITDVLSRLFSLRKLMKIF